MATINLVIYNNQNGDPNFEIFAGELHKNYSKGLKFVMCS